jgi:hypothetical protein
MALILTSDYSKKLGLPGFSSHQFSVSIQTELTDLDRVPGEVARLYQLLQQAVDREIQQTGFVPGDGYGEIPRALPAANGNGNGSNVHPDADAEVIWQCSDRQRELITDLAAELKLDDASLDKRSERLFRRPACQLNKLCASGLISDLLAEAGTRRQREGRNGGHESAPHPRHPGGNGNGHGNVNGGSHSRSSNGHPRPAVHRNGGAA